MLSAHADLQPFPNAASIRKMVQRGFDRPPGVSGNAVTASVPPGRAALAAECLQPGRRYIFKSSSSLLVAEPKNNKSAERPQVCGRVGDPSVGSAGKESDTLLGNYATEVLSSGRSVGGQI